SPSELDVRVAPHPAQAFTDAPCGTRSLLSVFLARGSADDSWRVVTPCYPPRLTTDHTSSLLSLPEIFHPTATCPRLGQLPTQPCLQVQFPLRIVGIDGAADLHITNDPHLGCCHQLNRPTLA